MLRYTVSEGDFDHVRFTPHRHIGRRDAPFAARRRRRRHPRLQLRARAASRVRHRAHHRAGHAGYQDAVVEPLHRLPPRAAHPRTRGALRRARTHGRARTGRRPQPRAARARLRRLPCAHALVGQGAPRGRRLHGALHRLRPARRHHAEAPLLRAVRRAEHPLPAYVVLLMRSGWPCRAAGARAALPAHREAVELGAVPGCHHRPQAQDLRDRLARRDGAGVERHPRLRLRQRARAAGLHPRRRRRHPHAHHVLRRNRRYARGVGRRRVPARPRPHRARQPRVHHGRARGSHHRGRQALSGEDGLPRLRELRHQVRRARRLLPLLRGEHALRAQHLLHEPGRSELRRAHRARVPARRDHRVPRGVQPVRLQLRAALRARPQHGEPCAPAAGRGDAAPHVRAPTRCTTAPTRSSTTSGRRPCT